MPCRRYAHRVGIALHDVVRLTQDIACPSAWPGTELPPGGFKRGEIGAVVDIHQHPQRGYTVEFVEPTGRTRALVDLTPD